MSKSKSQPNKAHKARKNIVKAKERTRKTVRFADIPATTEFTPVSKDEASTVWYQPADYLAMDVERRESIHAITRGALCHQKPEELCFTGLEGQLYKSQIISRRISALQYTQYVLTTQKNQCVMGNSPDPAGLLGLLSQKLSAHSIRRARLRAMLCCNGIEARNTNVDFSMLMGSAEAPTAGPGAAGGNTLTARQA